MSFDPLPHDVEQSVMRFAHEQHLSHAEAVLRLIEAGLGVQVPKKKGKHSLVSPSTQSKGELAAANEARAARNATRRANRTALAQARPATPDALIGYLADSPETAENIRRLAYDRRNQSFGNL